MRWDQKRILRNIGAEVIEVLGAGGAAEELRGIRGGFLAEEGVEGELGDAVLYEVEVAGIVLLWDCCGRAGRGHQVAISSILKYSTSR